ncbi:hypothetical protein Btru_016644 [Bulinus truncatus]|nr:hypothetical protein Btru_016644 [Bulinus truncatus]
MIQEKVKAKKSGYADLNNHRGERVTPRDTNCSSTLLLRTPKSESRPWNIDNYSVRHPGLTYTGGTMECNATHCPAKSPGLEKTFDVRHNAGKWSPEQEVISSITLTLSGQVLDPSRDRRDRSLCAVGQCTIQGMTLSVDTGCRLYSLWTLDVGCTLSGHWMLAVLSVDTGCWLYSQWTQDVGCTLSGHWMLAVLSDKTL